LLNYFVKWRKENKDSVLEYNRNLSKDIKRAHRLSYKKIKTKCPCSMCGEIKAEKHHPDYKYPLSIIWLCKKHHAEEHVKIRMNK
jgi:hypothetical protein